MTRNLFYEQSWIVTKRSCPSESDHYRETLVLRYRFKFALSCQNFWFGRPVLLVVHRTSIVKINLFYSNFWYSYNRSPISWCAMWTQANIYLLSFLAISQQNETPYHFQRCGRSSLQFRTLRQSVMRPSFFITVSRLINICAKLLYYT